MTPNLRTRIPSWRLVAALPALLLAAAAGSPPAPFVAVADWPQQAYVKSMTNMPGGNFGQSVAVSGRTMVVGAPFEANISGGSQIVGAGAAYIYYRTDSTWAPQATLAHPFPDSGASGPPVTIADNFGTSVAISADTVVVGVPGDDSNSDLNGDPSNTDLQNAGDSGAAFVYVRSGATWTQQAYLKADSSHRAKGDKFGWSVAIDGDSIVVAAPWRTDATVNRGAAFVFARSGGVWTQQAYLLPAGNVAGLLAGVGGVAINGSRIVMGAPYEDTSQVDSGAAYAFLWNGSTWSTSSAAIKKTTPSVGEQFGASVGVNTDTLVAGAPYNDTGSTDTGAAFVFTAAPAANSWSQQATLQPVVHDANDHFGASVAITAGEIIVGAPDEDSATNGNASDNSAADSGAAYVFTGSGNSWSQEDYLKAATDVVAGDHFGAATAIAGNFAIAGAPGEDSTAYGVVTDPADAGSLGSGAAYVLVRPVAAADPAPDQYNAQGGTISVGATSHTGFTVRSAVNHADGYSIRLHVEVKNINTAFDDSGTVYDSSPMVAGGTASVFIPANALPAGDYHWRALSRVMFNTSASGDSAWISFGSNSDGAPPGTPAVKDITLATDLAPTLGAGVQTHADGSSVGLGQIFVEGDSIYFRAPAGDADNDNLTLQVEVLPVGQTFLNQATVPATMMSPGTIVAGPLDGLPVGSYHWQCHVVDEGGIGNASGWQSFGSSSVAEVDFIVGPVGSTDSRKCHGAAGGSGSPLLGLGLALAVVLAAARRPFARA